jgi:small-conductance mechanosensitive channel
VRELGELLLHPSRWNDLSGLAPHHRILLSLGILALTIVLAWVVGALSGRWASARAQKSGATENGGSRVAAPVADRIRRIRRGLMLVTLFGGAYLACEAAPLPDRVSSIVEGTLYVLAVWTIARLVIHVITLLLTTSVAHVPGEERARVEREYVPLAHKISALAVTLIGVIVVAKHFGQDVTSLIAALGVGSLAIGLAAQQTLGNMIAGFVLLVDRPFRPGDRIKLASGEAGEVLEIGVRSTRILLDNRNLLIVPNTELVNSRVINYAFPTSSSRGDVRVQVAPTADVDRASAILVEIAGEDERVLKNTPQAMVASIRPGAVELALGFDVVQHADAAGVEERIRRKILQRFAAAKIALASGISDVRVVSG